MAPAFCWDLSRHNRRTRTHPFLRFGSNNRISKNLEDDSCKRKGLHRHSRHQVRDRIRYKKRSRFHRNKKRLNRPSRYDKDKVEGESKQKQSGDKTNLASGGGVYVPPFKLARMMKEAEDNKGSTEYQRITWDALRRSLNGLINKVNSTNIKNVIPEFFAENLIRGRGLFCRCCLKAQMASPRFTDVFAALVAVLNTKFPDVGFYC